eukprot:UN22213
MGGLDDDIFSAYGGISTQANDVQEDEAPEFYDADDNDDLLDEKSQSTDDVDDFKIDKQEVNPEDCEYAFDDECIAVDHAVAKETQQEELSDPIP